MSKNGKEIPKVLRDHPIIIKALKKALDENKSNDELKKLSEELQQTMYSISQKAYEQVQKETQAQEAGIEYEEREFEQDDYTEV